MKPVEPIVPGRHLPLVRIAEHQLEYETMPSYVYDDGTILTRWHMTLRERLRVLFTGDVYVWQQTFNHRVNPIGMETKKPIV